MQYEYLIFNLLVIAGPIMAGKIYRKTKYPSWRKALRAIIPVAVGFVIWDHLVTEWWWNFNPKYILGWKVGRLPVEEILFFVTVPYACLLIWENMKSRWGTISRVNSVWMKLLVVTGLGLVLITGLQKWSYTITVLVLWILAVLGDWVCKIGLFEKKIFYLFLVVIGLLTGLWNGYLTARPVVTYNPQVKSNLNIGTIPIEDFIFGFILITTVTMVYEIKQGKPENI